MEGGRRREGEREGMSEREAGGGERLFCGRQAGK